MKPVSNKLHNKDRVNPCRFHTAKSAMQCLLSPLNPIEKNSKETTQTEEYEYYLYNERYQLIKQKKVQANRFQINTNDLPEGFYFLNVVSGEQVWKNWLSVKYHRNILNNPFSNPQPADQKQIPVKNHKKNSARCFFPCKQIIY